MAIVFLSGFLLVVFIIWMWISQSRHQHHHQSNNTYFGREISPMLHTQKSFKIIRHIILHEQSSSYVLNDEVMSWLVKDEYVRNKLNDCYLDLNDDLLPTGKYNAVNGTEYDFRDRSVIGKGGFKGLDDIFVLTGGKEKAILSSKESGIQMKVDTNQPVMVIYTPPKFGKLPFKDAAVFSEFPAICFEAQGFPDALNNSHFPQTLLKPGETFKSETSFKFSNI